MKIDKAKLCNALANYAESEIIPKMIISSDSFSDKTNQIIAYTSVSMFKRNKNLQDKIFEKLPIINYLFDEDGCIEINDVLTSLKEAMEHYGEFCITILGQKLKFNSSDIEVLYKYLN